ncbi:MAG: hypothetical protein V2J02_15280 [Pseudomonadales bacterium]|jgi:hypothetical protein|nr:hypothetical protein [Pseudomonadales bacterium]
MNALRLLLVVLWLVLAVHTGIVGLRHGWNLLPVFFRDIAAFGWPGQFDLDFLCFLVLSGLWTSWRHRFTAGGLGLGVAAFFGGFLFLAPYLLVASLRARGDVATVLLGPSRVPTTA